MPNKTCKKCGIEKSETDFTIKDKHYGYRNSTCKQCEAERVRKYYAENAEYRTRAQMRSRGESVPVKLVPRIVSWDETTQTKACSKCGRELPLAAYAKQLCGKFGRISVCSECRHAIGSEAKKSGAWRSWTTKGRREYKLQKLYSISSSDYDDLFKKQNGCCALCGTKTPDAKRAISYLVVDHDHRTGEIRGLLCAPCNVWLGNYETLLERAGEEAIKSYLKRTA